MGRKQRIIINRVTTENIQQYIQQSPAGERTSLSSMVINDLEENVNSNMIEFVDDTNLGWI